MQFLDRAGYRRFIPAYAGNTSLCSDARRRNPVHPRVCGEHYNHDLVAHGEIGSSPRMRGTHQQRKLEATMQRFIPAYAGNTRGDHPRLGTSPVHPRVCGEHLTLPPVVRHPLGSSPRMRGTRSCIRLSPDMSRFIPAYAGNTSGIVGGGACVTVHPRVCGEHFCLRECKTSSDGSSPRMRGTLGSRIRQPEGFRFIPAYAGNTSSGGATCRSAPVHPSVCGEHPRASFSRLLDLGSSPRMRGTPARIRKQAPAGRFIPAYAGNTRSPDPFCARPAVHPRVCGEHSD